MRALIPLAATTLLACMPSLPNEAGRGDSIIGGTTDTQDPSVVSLLLADGMPDCTASVIAPRVLLTAAHCVDTVSAYVAAWGTDETAPQQRIDILETHADLAFDDTDFDAGHDIAVAILGSDAPTPALRLASGSLTSSIVGTSVRLVGFGVSATDQSGGGTKRQISLSVAALRPNHIQVGTPGRAACHGDSGGPMFATVGGQESIIGVTSYGTDDDCASGVAYYQRLDLAMAFVRPYLDGTAQIGMGSTGPSSTAGTDPGASDPGAPDPGTVDPGTGDKGGDKGGGDKGGDCDPSLPGCK